MAPSDKQIKAATKEGGKKGQDLCGMADLGSIVTFTVALESPEAVDDAEGAWALMQAAMDGANKPVDEAGEDRKGGAGELAKLFCAAPKSALIIYCHVPAALKEKVDIEEWTGEVLTAIGHGSVTETSEDKTYIKIQCDQDQSKEKFPIKMKDTAINASFAFLKKKGLVMDDDSDDDVDYSAMQDGAGIEW